MGKWRYGVILDAGSSGTRAYVYRWLKAERAPDKVSQEALSKLPELHTKKSWTMKIHPGLSTFGEKPEMVGEEHLKDLVAHALDKVPADEVENTPIFLMATAGMRLLPEVQRKAVLANVCSYFQRTTKFQLPDCDMHIQVIPGATEGLYGWLAANYLLGGFDEPKSDGHGKEHPTYGFLDMGGASAQIAFAPSSTEAEKHANDLTLLRLRTVGGQQKEYRVFVTTWLEYGVNEARRRYLEALAQAYTAADTWPDPCLPSGLIETKAGKVMEKGATSEEPQLLGTGKFTECLKQTFPLLDKDSKKVACQDEPCLLHGVHVPAIDFDVNHFVGVSEYWHTTHSVFKTDDKNQAYDFKTFQAKVDQFCTSDWSSIQSGVSSQKWGKKVDETTAAEVCFKASWLINMLHEGIGVPRVGLEESPSHGSTGNKTSSALSAAKDRGLVPAFQAVDKIDGTEVSWTLGKMVLYASSRHPAASPDVKAVGFGSNVPGALPADFQFAGGKFDPLPDSSRPDPGNGPDDDMDWHDTLFASASNRRVPGLLLFLAILVLALFLLCGRERRNAILSRITGRPVLGGGSSSKRGGKRGFLARLLGRGPAKRDSGGKYESVPLRGPEDFELGEDEDYSDDDAGLGSPAKRQTAGRASGLATPKMLAESPMLGGSSPKGKGYFEGSAAPAGSLGARTGSRERLTAQGLGLGASGSRSRHASPTRRASPLTNFKGQSD